MGRVHSPLQIANAAPMRPRRAVLCLLALLLLMMPVRAALAQNDALPGTASSPAERAQMLLNADSLTYNRDKDVVTASGHVQIHYKGRALQADKVRYDRKSKRVFASGHAKLTDPDGTVSYADRFELTDDFKQGFIDGLRSDTADKTHFSAARAERGGDVTTLDHGLYSACKPCARHPERAPLWQIKARRIIANGKSHEIYYEDAYLEFLGVPIAYVPYFSSPDSSVTRKSGFLAPQYFYKTALGVTVTTPYFWDLAPNYDLTFSPTFLTRQGFLGDIEWRHRLSNGAYSIRVAGIAQQDRQVFYDPPFGPGSKVLRGEIDSKGEFNINKNWKFGWNGSYATDKWFDSDYKLSAADYAQTYFGEKRSDIYLTGQSARSYFNLSSDYFAGLSKFDLQSQQAQVWPSLAYNRAFSLDPATTGGIGGEFDLDANVTHISRQLADWQSTGLRQFDNAFSLFDVCTSYTPGIANGHCLLRGIGGDYTRATLNLSWKRRFIDPLGAEWTPFIFGHLNGEWLSLNTSDGATFSSASGTSTISNAPQTNYFGGKTNGFAGQAIPGAGVDYRYPFYARLGSTTQIIEPIAQIIARPNTPASTMLPNEDSQSLVFDDTSLFEWSKFSGNDRFETGVRANVGGQYTVDFDDGGYANIMAGRSFQVAGQNAYATLDAANIGFGSGLGKTASDYVTRLTLAPNAHFALIAKARIGPRHLGAKRLDIAANTNFGGLSTSLLYARYTAQPALGYAYRREGLAASAKYHFDKNYYVDGQVVFDLSRYLYNGALVKVSRFAVSSAGAGFGYINDCISFGVNYTSTYTDPTSSSRTRNQTVMVKLQLRTLGSTSVHQNLGTNQVNAAY